MWYYDSQFSAVNKRLDTITTMLKQLLTQEAQLAVDLAALTTEVTTNTSETASVIALLGNLTTLIKAIPPSTDPVTQAALDQLTATLTSNDTAIAGAVVANTPSATAASKAPK